MENSAAGPPWRIAPVTALPPGLEALRAEAAAEGFRFLDRMIREWNAGLNRFNARGERCLAAFHHETLVAICGLNQDPYTQQAEVARLRHLYVSPTARRTGIASALVQHLIDAASRDFHTVRLRTTPAAATFYVKLGFTPVDDATATHLKRLRS